MLGLFEIFCFHFSVACLLTVAKLSAYIAKCMTTIDMIYCIKTRIQCVWRNKKEN